MDSSKKFKIILGSSFETTKPYLVPTVIEEWCQNLKYRLNNAKITEEKIEAILEATYKIWKKFILLEMEMEELVGY